MSEKDRLDRSKPKRKRRVTSKDIARMEQKYGMPMYKKNPDKYANKKPLPVRILLGFLGPSPPLCASNARFAAGEPLAAFDEIARIKY